MKLPAKLTPLVRPKMLSRSGGVSTSIPTILSVKPGAYSSILEKTCHGERKVLALIVRDKGRKNTRCFTGELGL
jgi:hypothetical protein